MKGVKNKFKKILLISFVLFISFFRINTVMAEELLQVSIPPNPYNSMAEQLKNKESKLNEREKSLASLQTKIENSYQKIFVLIAGLFMLILLNFLLDIFRRQKKDGASLDVNRKTIN